MNWLWLNVPMAVVFFLAMTAIPLWLVFKRPDTGPVVVGQSGTARAQAALQPELDALATDLDVRELAGASR